MTQKFELQRWDVVEMSPVEMDETEGGFLPFLIIGAAVLLGGCGNTVIYNGGGTNTNTASSSASVDSSGNGSGNGNRFP